MIFGKFVILAKARTQLPFAQKRMVIMRKQSWVLAFARMTAMGNDRPNLHQQILFPIVSAAK